MVRLTLYETMVMIEGNDFHLTVCMTYIVL